MRKKSILLTALILIPILTSIFFSCENNAGSSSSDLSKNSSSINGDSSMTYYSDIVSDIKTKPVLVIKAGDRVFYAELEDNSSAEAFVQKLNLGPIEIDMHDYGNFEKVGDLPFELPTNDERITTVPGDIILYQGNKVTIYYDENTWNFTRLARIGNVSEEDLLDALGEGDITVTFLIEWSE